MPCRPCRARLRIGGILLALVALLTHLLGVTAGATQGWKVRAALVAALIAFAAVGASGLIAERFWHVVHTHARTGALPADPADPADLADLAER